MSPEVAEGFRARRKAGPGSASATATAAATSSFLASVTAVGAGISWGGTKLGAGGGHEGHCRVPRCPPGLTLSTRWQRMSPCELRKKVEKAS